MTPTNTPEQRAREHIDHQLEKAGWAIQSRDEINLHEAKGVAIREFSLKQGHGFADYMLFVDAKPVGVLEAKPEGHTLSGVESQAQKYIEGLQPTLTPPVRPLPFMYISTGIETQFTNLLDPKPRARRVFSIHQPETLAEWLNADPLATWSASWSNQTPAQDAAERNPSYQGLRAVGDNYPSTLRSRLQVMPPLQGKGLWPNQVEAITNLERSLWENRPRALLQMATGSGKTLTSVSFIYRLIKFAGARRVLFLVDRSNLGEQTEREFESYRTPDDNRKFTELYNVQRLGSNTIGSSSKVVVSTIQRLYSILKGEPDFDPANEEDSQFEDNPLHKEPLPVIYNQGIPPEYFDFIVIDECHRSIYSLWRQVLEYFDAFLIGLTATPASHTFGFFQKNLVMEYNHERAVSDGVNVDFEIYKIRTKITKQGSTIQATPGVVVGKRDRQTRAVRWEQPDEDIHYTASQLDRDVVTIDQIRLIIRTFKERLFTEIFPHRTKVPKTLIFAKDDSHAEDIVKIVREEFAQGNDFCTKITYKTTGKKPKELLQDFRNSYYPRIAVTVDMIATGTDVKPIEIVMFMRTVKSRVLFEQMKGRGVRIIDKDEFKAVTPDAEAKTHFVMIDCVGQSETQLSASQPLERKKGVAFKELLEQVAFGSTDSEVLSSLVSRLVRLNRQCNEEDHALIQEASGGVSLTQMTHAITQALDPDHQEAQARQDNALPEDAAPTEAQVEAATQHLLQEALKPIAQKPKLRKTLLEIKRVHEQLLDEVSIDTLITEETGFSVDAKDKAKTLTQSFKSFLEENKDEIEALQFFYAQPHSRRLTHKDIKALVKAIEAPPRQWTPERLWKAYEALDKSRVRGASSKRMLTDMISLVRFALEQDDQLVPYEAEIQARFTNWLAQQQNKGRAFDPQQLRWLEMIRDQIATSLEIALDDFDYTPFTEQGGLGKARKIFGQDLAPLLKELNEALAA
ncbi:MAG: DEAD/DEAH box helicase family protein [Myxococcales bacterium]|nr:DEAD/DEAH box helicase family protein [Myxococcales bacterium]